MPTPLRPRGRLRVPEADQPGLRQRVDGDDLRAAALRQLQRGEHPRVVGAGVLADDEDEVGLLDVVEGDACPCRRRSCRRAPTPLDSWHMFEQSGRLFVPKRPHEELVERTRPRCSCGPTCRRRRGRATPGRAARRGDQREGVVPRDRLVVVGARGPVHRLGEPALLAEPVLAALGQLGDRVLGEERAVRRGAAVASQATALAPFSQNSKRDGACAARARRSPGSRSPPCWLSRSSVRTPRRSPIWSCTWRSEPMHRRAGRRPPGRAASTRSCSSPWSSVGAGFVIAAERTPAIRRRPRGAARALRSDQPGTSLSTPAPSVSRYTSPLASVPKPDTIPRPLRSSRTVSSLAPIANTGPLMSANR